MGDGYEGKFVPYNAWSSKPEPSETVNAFQMGEEYLNLFTFGLGFGVEGRFSGQSGQVARIFMFPTIDETGVWAAYWFRRTGIAYGFPPYAKRLLPEGEKRCDS